MKSLSAVTHILRRSTFLTSCNSSLDCGIEIGLLAQVEALGERGTIAVTDSHQHSLRVDSPVAEGGHGEGAGPLTHLLGAAVSASHLSLRRGALCSSSVASLTHDLSLAQLRDATTRLALCSVVYDALTGIPTPSRDRLCRPASQYGAHACGIIGPVFGVLHAAMAVPRPCFAQRRLQVLPYRLSYALQCKVRNAAHGC